ncbi:uncharacterized protein EHS24_005649 [Apiotrichum porosum]|uniref:Uncharacterized protein n=1 Tax=Apiotrichum porosum TaxID=105984 RepID=A0A427XZ47_9TREE|nr:uncharacterized protein EHS24_005649 [Apiotrichum porosum]RSH84146.1 hypothetical protein EHS24_005649 [Apiotrichum porosum]
MSRTQVTETDASIMANQPTNEQIAQDPLHMDYPPVLYRSSRLPTVPPYFGQLRGRAVWPLHEETTARRHRQLVNRLFGYQEYPHADHYSRDEPETDGWLTASKEEDDGTVSIKFNAVDTVLPPVSEQPCPEGAALHYLVYIGPTLVKTDGTQSDRPAHRPDNHRLSPARMYQALAPAKDGDRLVDALAIALRAIGLDQGGAKYVPVCHRCHRHDITQCFGIKSAVIDGNCIYCFFKKHFKAVQ